MRKFENLLSRNFQYNMESQEYLFLRKKTGGFVNQQLKNFSCNVRLVVRFDGQNWFFKYENQALSS